MVGLVCKLRVFSACNLVICKGDLVVDISMVVMAMSFSEFLVELDKHKDTGPTQRPHTNRDH